MTDGVPLVRPWDLLRRFRLDQSNAAQSAGLLFVFSACLLLAGILTVVRKLKDKLTKPLEVFDTGSPRGELHRRDWFFINWATLCSGLVAGLSWVAAEAQVHLVPLLGSSGFQGVVIGMAIGFVAQAVIQITRGHADGQQPYRPPQPYIPPPMPPYQPQPGPNTPLPYQSQYPNPNQPPPPLA